MRHRSKAMSKQEKSPGGNLGGNNGKRASFRQPHSTTTGRGASIPIYIGKKAIGHVQGDTFYKAVRSSVHFLRRPRAIAFDVSTLHDAEAAGARRVEVTDSDTGRVYQLPLSTVWAEGFEFNRGFGDQWGVPLDEWLRPGEQTAEQPSLFGGGAS